MNTQGIPEILTVDLSIAFFLNSQLQLCQTYSRKEILTFLNNMYALDSATTVMKGWKYRLKLESMLCCLFGTTTTYSEIRIMDSDKNVSSVLCSIST